MGVGRGEGKRVCVVLNRFYVTTTLVLSSAVVYTRHLFIPREEFLTHQYNIFKPLYCKRMGVNVGPHCNPNM